MIKKAITYTNFDDKEVTEVFYFNLTEEELLELEFKYGGDLSSRFNFLYEKKDLKGQLDMIKDIVISAYGEKTKDGRFIKNRDVHDEFAATGAFSKLIIDMLKQDNEFANFMTAIIPVEMQANVKAKIEEAKAEAKDE